MDELIRYLKERGINYLSEEGRINEYFNYLEDLRKSGQTNMYGAGPYLRATFNLTLPESNTILSCWMKFYSLLNKKFNWR